MTDSAQPKWLPSQDINVLIIGDSSGMGFAVTKLAFAGKANVFIASSNKDKVDAAVNRLQADSPSGQVAG